MSILNIIFAVSGFIAFFATKCIVNDLAGARAPKQKIIGWCVIGGITVFIATIVALGGPVGIYRFFEARPETNYGSTEFAGEVGLWLTVSLAGVIILAKTYAIGHDALLYRSIVVERFVKRVVREAKH